MTLVKKTIIITGSSSGLGAALAKKYAANDVILFLFGRSFERLKTVADDCIIKGAEVKILCGDVKEASWMKTQIEEISKNYNVDILIACAGVSAGTLKHPETHTQVNEIFTTNIGGTMNTIMPALPFMIKNKCGQIVLVSSVAGLLPFANAPSYSASKAAVKTFGDSLRVYLNQYQVRVCVVIPGYIDTPMTKVNRFPMPFMVRADRAADIIISGLAKNKGVIAFPFIVYIILKLINLLPYRLLDYINSKLPGKPAFDQ